MLFAMQVMIKDKWTTRFVFVAEDKWIADAFRAGWHENSMWINHQTQVSEPTEEERTWTPHERLHDGTWIGNDPTMLKAQEGDVYTEEEAD